MSTPGATRRPERPSYRPRTWIRPIEAGRIGQAYFEPHNAQRTTKESRTGERSGRLWLIFSAPLRSA